MTATAVRELPILFSGPMVRAILDGRKSQTRRVVKWEPLVAGCNLNFSGISLGFYDTTNPDSGYVLRSRGGGGCWNDRTRPVRSPYGQPGDLLYVRETAELQYIAGDYWVCYEADRDGTVIEEPDDATLAWIEKAKWKTAEPGVSVTPRRRGMLVPKSLSRIWLRVTDVRVERLQEITEEDAVAEGCVESTAPIPELEGASFGGGFDSASGNFQILWDSLNAKRAPWDSDPRVWVIPFERTEAP